MNIVSIIIPHYNGEEMIYNCINSIYNNISINNFEIIVVDNASNDNSINRIKNSFENVKIVSNKSNLGYSQGCNIGANHANGKYLLFLNNDTEHSEGWIEQLINFLDNNSKIAAVQPKILNIHNKKLFDYAGGAGGFLDKFCFPFVKGRIFHTLEEDLDQYNNHSKIFWASGAALMMRSEIFNKLEGFEKIYFAYMEEIDLCWRAQSLGYEIWYCSDSYIYHHGPYKNFRKNSMTSLYLNHRNSWILFLKNSYSFNYGLSIIVKLFLDWITLLYSLLRLDLKRFFGIIKAHLWLSIYLWKVIKLRQLNKYRFNKLDNIYNGSIVVDYFIKRKKYFSQISLR